MHCLCDWRAQGINAFSFGDRQISKLWRERNKEKQNLRQRMIFRTLQVFKAVRKSTGIHADKQTKRGGAREHRTKVSLRSDRWSSSSTST
mmetsp:Transcript_30420/g.59748  ORF Transcript_30420/g.59748 Transcript_30420/m.59748 type:complete len:90 (-) Transcript_30420:378-647(-)